MPTTHPTPDELAALATGRLTSEAVDAVADHVDTCIDCRNALDTLAASDNSLAALLQQSPANDEFADEAELRHAISRLNAIVAARLPELDPSSDAASRQLTPSVAVGDTEALALTSTAGANGQSAVGSVDQLDGQDENRRVAEWVLSIGGKLQTERMRSRTTG